MTLNECLKFPNQLVKQLQRRVHRLGAGHVHPGDLQQADGVGAAAGGQESEVILDRRSALVQYAVCDRDRRDDSGRVLVDVEARVEVRYARPLVGDLRVGDDRAAVVLFISSAALVNSVK